MAPDDSSPDVLSSLPRTRPQRRSSKRGGAAAGPAAAAGRPATPARKPAKAKAKATRADKPKAAPRKIPDAGFQPPAEEAAGGTPGAPEILGTAIQAAAELAQLGLAASGHVLRSALGRLGRR